MALAEIMPTPSEPSHLLPKTGSAYLFPTCQTLEVGGHMHSKLMYVLAWSKILITCIAFEGEYQEVYLVTSIKHSPISSSNTNTPYRDTSALSVLLRLHLS